MHSTRCSASLMSESSGRMETNRDRILHYFLQHKAGVKVNELSQYLQISRTAVQNYFVTLEKQNLIKKNQHIKTRGRPSIDYVLTTQGIHYFAKQYALFAQILLQELHTQLKPAQLIALMQKMGKKMAIHYQPRFVGLNEYQRMETLLQLMQELGFNAEAHRETGSHTVIISAQNCIYHDVAQQFHEICNLDQTLITELSGNTVELQSCIAKGDNACCFRMSFTRHSG